MAEQADLPALSEVAQGMGDLALQAEGVVRQAISIYYSRDQANGIQMAEQALALMEELGLWRGRATMANNLGLLMWRPVLPISAVGNPKAT